MFKKISKISMEDMEKIFNEVLNSDSIMNIKNMGENIGSYAKETVNKASSLIHTFDNYNVKEEESVITYAINVAGLDKDDVHVNVEDGLLKISTNSSTDSNAVLTFGAKVVNLQFVIIKDYLDADIDASLENGLLTVILTKKQTSPKTPKTIKIK